MKEAMMRMYGWPPVDMAHLRYGPDDMAHGAVYMAQPVGRYGPAIMDQELQ